MKMATVILADLCAGAGLTRPDDWAFVAMVHDEWCIECLDEAAPLIATTAVKAIHQAGYAFNFNMPLDGEATIGENWWQVH
jgi:DNA polymerase I-like protein with 3'-5' exonuclease and polymerase domains